MLDRYFTVHLIILIIKEITSLIDLFLLISVQLLSYSMTYWSTFVSSFSVIGTILIVIGLYAVVWGKSKERSASMKDVKTIDHELPISNGTKKLPTSVDSKNDATALEENVVKVPINPQGSWDSCPWFGWKFNLQFSKSPLCEIVFLSF